MEQTKLESNKIKDIAKIISEIDRKSLDFDISIEKLAKMIDHTELSPCKTTNMIEKFCRKSKKYNFQTVCVNPYYTRVCSNQLKNENIGVDTVIGFPLGQTSTQEKISEATYAVKDGTTEVDMVMNIAAFKEGKYDFVEEEIKKVKEAVGDRLMKVIIETSLLKYQEITKASKLVEKSGADFVKSSTGFGPFGANVLHIHLIKKAVGNDIGIKASGGINNFRNAARMIAAGANRIGASAGIKILKDHKEKDQRNWSIEKEPCNLCPSRKELIEKVPKEIKDNYKEKCEKCSYK